MLTGDGGEGQDNSWVGDLREFLPRDYHIKIRKEQNEQYNPIIACVDVTYIWNFVVCD